MPRTVPSSSALPVAYESVDVARTAIQELVDAGASGAVATRAGSTVGFVLGSRRDETWGANVWVEPAGHAVDEPETVRDLYALAATRWMEEGRNAHYAVVPTNDPALVDAWFRVGFGLQHVHALREAPAEPVTVVPPGDRDPASGVATTSTRSRQLELALPGPPGALARASPRHRPPSLEEARAEWDEDFDNTAFATFVGEVDGRVVGSAVGCSVELSSLHSGLARPDEAAHLGFAAVLPEDARGAGVGTALGATVLDWAARRGLYRRHDRLARDESPLVAQLAEARVPADVLPALPRHRLTRRRRLLRRARLVGWSMPRVPLLAGTRVPIVTVDDDAQLLVPPAPLDAAADVARRCRRGAALSALRAGARRSRHAVEAAR